MLSGLPQCPLFFSLSLSLELSPGKRQWVMVVIWATADRFYNVNSKINYKECIKKDKHSLIFSCKQLQDYHNIAD